MTNKDYYEALGVPRNASKDNIKKAYHKLARAYHPDNKTTGDEARFKEINEAYYTLSDDKRRAEYDTYGHVFSGAGGASGFGGGSPFEGFGGFGQEFDLGDIFGEFFEGFGGGARGRVRRGRDISLDIDVSFSESVYGTRRSVLVGKTALCGTCGGTGAEPKTKMVRCEKCNGQGNVRDTRTSVFGTFTSVRECGACAGSGSVPKEHCHTCYGAGVLKKQEEITIEVPAGIENGEVIRITGAGEAVARGTAGDLYARVHVAKHPVFRREGMNLVMTLNIKLSDALAGADYTIHTLDGTPLTVKIPAGVSFGEILRVKGKGIPISRYQRGDMLVKIHINLPSKLSRRARELIEKLRSEGI